MCVCGGLAGRLKTTRVCARGKERCEGDGDGGTVVGKIRDCFSRTLNTRADMAFCSSSSSSSSSSSFVARGRRRVEGRV